MLPRIKGISMPPASLSLLLFRLFTIKLAMSMNLTFLKIKNYLYQKMKKKNVEGALKITLLVPPVVYPKGFFWARP